MNAWFGGGGVLCSELTLLPLLQLQATLEHIYHYLVQESNLIGWSLNERKWSADKCSEVEWSVVEWSLNERKWSVDKCSEVEWSVVEWSLNERKWSAEKCSEVEWSVVEWSLNERKWSADKCGEVEWSVVGWSVVKCSEGLRNRMSTIIRRYIDYTKFAASIGFSFIIFFSYYFDSIFYHCICGFMFCVLLFNFVNCVFCIVMFIYSYCYVYVFLLLFMWCSTYSVSLCCSVYCLCVNVYCTTATGCQPNCS